MQFILLVTIDDGELDDDPTVEDAANFVTNAMRNHDEGAIPSSARPLSELFSC